MSEKEARGLLRRACGAGDWTVIEAALAAAEERGRRRGVEEAAEICENERACAWASSRAADAKGDHRVGAADAGTASTAQRLGERIRALAKEGKP